MPFKTMSVIDLLANADSGPSLHLGQIGTALFIGVSFTGLVKIVKILMIFQVALYASIYLVYNANFHPLAKFPGPLLARSSLVSPPSVASPAPVIVNPWATSYGDSIIQPREGSIWLSKQSTSGWVTTSSASRRAVKGQN